ncbi:MAG: riboflavin synthase [Flavobacteriaceae bacterium]|jgi:riboflavin synthase|nr:riboflavin synthase [Flavobacteriaceae bacterium]MDA8900216.1 riboflavin synthase [Flavobacteriaceae bacterium]MDA8992977.1 riboflavin synthase [Flavobacteriaceae bacterium]
MFTGIIEAFGRITALEKEDQNLHLTLQSPLAAELKIDQSLSHNGVCLTVVACNDSEYTVTAIKETLDKSNLGVLQIDALVNLERAMKLGDRLDGHIVQGHVDHTAKCTNIRFEGGSWVFSFEYTSATPHVTIEKGSITVNGVSLTVVDSKTHGFSVAIIPYTYEHTNFHTFEVGSIVNIEFDMIGKYISKLHAK